MMVIENFISDFAIMNSQWEISSASERMDLNHVSYEVTFPDVCYKKQSGWC